MRLGVITCGGSNLTSVVNALRRIGARPDLLTAPEGKVDLLLMPGVGAFGAAMRRLKEAGFDEYFLSHVRAGKPAMGICLGMQILFESSEEDPGVAGLAAFPGVIRKLKGHDSPVLRSPPNIGYNHVQFNAAAEVSPRRRELERHSGYFYFLHSYALTEKSVPMEITGTSFFNDDRFYPFVMRDNVCGVQFHPERSGPPGLALLAHCLEVLE